MVAPYFVVISSCSLVFQFVHLSHILRNSIFLIPLSSSLLRLSAKGIHIVWDHNLRCWKWFIYLHISIFRILDLKFFVLWRFSPLFSHKFQKEKEIVSLKYCLLFQFRRHFFSTLDFISYFYLKYRYLLLFFVLCVPPFFLLEKNKRANTVHSVKTKIRY